MASTHNKDIQFICALQEPTPASPGPAKAETAAYPYGYPEHFSSKGAQNRGSIAVEILDIVTKLLDVLQPAHRAGALDPTDIGQMNQLALWYSKLQAELEQVRAYKVGHERKK